MSTLREDVAVWFDRATSLVARTPIGIEHRALGRVVRIADEVATVAGLPETSLGETLVFENGTRGMAVSLDEDAIGCVLLGPQTGIRAGSTVCGTGEVVHVPVGPELLGRVIDPLGVPLDGGELPRTAMR